MQWFSTLEWMAMLSARTWVPVPPKTSGVFSTFVPHVVVDRVLGPILAQGSTATGSNWPLTLISTHEASKTLNFTYLFYFDTMYWPLIVDIKMGNVVSLLILYSFAEPIHYSVLTELAINCTHRMVSHNPLIANNVAKSPTVWPWKVKDHIPSLIIHTCSMLLYS